jgi:4-diphosphocytidyl-2-C-methyl-D-erythritol kinase
VITEFAAAKVNLTLRVLGRRADGYHELESLVAFADVGDELGFTPGSALGLDVQGPRASAVGPSTDNLVLKAARALAALVPGLKLGRFHLTKTLPVAAGLGGGSADAAAALRLLARANAISTNDVRLAAAARATGADVPVCLDPRPRVMRGIGEVLSAPVVLPPLDAVLINPGVALATKDVFAGLNFPTSGEHSSSPSMAEHAPLQAIYDGVNDLEPPALALQPVIADVLAALRASDGCRVARMSGSGATCFGVFDTAGAASAAADALAAARPAWWVRKTSLG